MRVSFRLPLLFLRGNYTRTASMVLAIALGVALVCAIDLVNRAVLHAFMEVVDTMAGRAALQVTAGQGGLFPEEVVGAVAMVPGVELAVPVVSATAFTTGSPAELLTVHGVDVTNEAAVRVYDNRDAGGLELEDPLVFLNQADSIVLTRAFAVRRGLAVGSTLELETPTGRHRFTVRGLLEPRGVAEVYGGNLVVMDLLAAQAAFTRPGLVNRVDVVVERHADVDRVRSAIIAAVPPGLAVDTPAQRKADLHKTMQALQVMLQAVGLIALVAGFLIAFSRLATVYESRVWQLGILRAIGVRISGIWSELLFESVILGGVGVAVGIPLGIAGGRFLLPVVAATTSLNFKVVAPAGVLVIRPASLLLAASLGLLAALVAAALPAWRTARAAIIESIRARGVEQPQNGSRVMAWVRAAIVVSIAASVLVQGLTRSAAWGLLATGLTAVGVALMANPMLRLLRAWLMAPLARIAGPAEHLAVGMVAKNLRRSALTAAMIGVGLGSILWLRMVGHSFERSVYEALSSAFQGDLIVTSAHVVAGYVEAPIEERVVAALEEIPGVREVAGEHMVDWNHDGGPIAIDAFDPTYFVHRGLGEWRLRGAHAEDVWTAVAQGDAVLVSTNFVRNIPTRVGDTITLQAPTEAVRVRVAGITQNFASPRGTIFMSRELYKRFWHDGHVTRVLVGLDSEANVDDVRREIGERLGRQFDLHILSSRQLLEYFAVQVRRAFAPVDVLAVLVLVVLLVGVADTLAAGVIDRTRELGAMRALGVRRRTISRMVLEEGLLLGTAGIVLAAAAGVALGTLWVDATFPLLLGWALEAYIPYASLAISALATATVCVVSGLLPAWRAARVDPAVALRYE